MSLSSELRSAGPYLGEGVTVTFPFTFKVFQASDLLVERATSGAYLPLTFGSDYLVTLNSNQNATPGGNVTLGAALATGALLTITSNIPALQAVAIQTQGGFYPSVVNNALDLLTILIQQIKARPFTRRYPTETPDGVVTTFHFAGLPAGHFLQIYNGIINTGYTQADNALTFDVAPDAGTEIYCLY